MPHGYDRSETSVHFMNYHYVWCPKYRRAVLIGDIGKRLEELIRDKCKTLDGDVLSLSIASDHVHLFVKTNPRISPNKFIGLVKGFTSHELREEFPELKRKLPTLWTRSYFVSTHGHISDSMIQRYIEEQKGM
jgi:putative transposase